MLDYININGFVHKLQTGINEIISGPNVQHLPGVQGATTTLIKFSYDLYLLLMFIINNHEYQYKQCISGRQKTSRADYTFIW